MVDAAGPQVACSTLLVAVVGNRQGICGTLHTSSSINSCGNPWISTV